MKKILLPVFLLFYLNSQSQKIHASAGVAISKLDWSIPGLFKDPVTTAIGDIGLTYLDRKIFDVTSTVGYMQKGGKGIATFTDAAGNYISTETVKALLNYITVKNAVRVKLPAGRFKPFVTAGIYAGFLVSANENLNKSAFKTVNIGGIAGIGFLLKLLKNEIGIQANYLPSFNKLRNESINGYKSTIGDQTFSISAFVGIKI